MFNFLGGLIDCALGKNRKIIQTQAKTISTQKDTILRKDGEINSTKDSLYKEIVGRDNDRKEFEKVRNKFKHLAQKEEDEILKATSKRKKKRNLDDISTADIIKGKNKKGGKNKSGMDND